MSLEVYHRKRKFDLTPEPRGRIGRRKGNQYVIQKHAARRLHYDLRLELDGVMKSWAITKGPSLVPGSKCRYTQSKYWCNVAIELPMEHADIPRN